MVTVTELYDARVRDGRLKDDAAQRAVLPILDRIAAGVADAPAPARSGGWRRLFGEVGLLHLDTPIELIEDAFDDLRIFAGYAGWDAGQLEGELFRGSWYVTSARHSDVFDPDPTTLWRRTVHRQVSDVAIYATWPDNPELN